MRQPVRLVTVRWFGALLVMGLLFISTTMAFAQEEPVDEPAEAELTTQVYMPLVARSTTLAQSDDGFQNFSKEELRQFVRTALADELTMEQAKEVFDSLTEMEHKFVVETIDEQLEKISEEANKQAAKDAERTADEAEYVEVTAAGNPPGAVWDQMIENTWTTSNPPNASSWYTTQTSCDNDPDWEYIFKWDSFNSSNPDAIRWTTGWPVLYTALQGKAYKGYAFNYNEFRLCVSNERV